jgi:predicted nucleic acid-binding Zn ribbon protein
MDCPNCGTWNPDDKKVCWRCQALLPLPDEEKPKRPFTILGMQVWVILLLLAMLLMPLFMGRCGLMPG